MKCLCSPLERSSAITTQPLLYTNKPVGRIQKVCTYIFRIIIFKVTSFVDIPIYPILESDHIHTHTHARTHARMHTRTHTCTHTHTHTHTHTDQWQAARSGFPWPLPPTPALSSSSSQPGPLGPHTGGGQGRPVADGDGSASVLLAPPRKRTEGSPQARVIVGYRCCALEAPPQSPLLGWETVRRDNKE